MDRPSVAQLFSVESSIEALSASLMIIKVYLRKSAGVFTYLGCQNWDSERDELTGLQLDESENHS